MPRLAIAIAAAVTACWLAGCGGPSTTLVQCADSWNAKSGEKRSLTQTGVSVRVARFDGGECALVINAGGGIGGLVERDGRWRNYIEPTGPADALDTANEMQRLAPALVAQGNQPPNVTIDQAGNLRPLAGAAIGDLGVGL